MTEIEYLKKLEAFQVSDAPLEVKEKAINDLKAKFKLTEAANIAREDYFAGKADIDDIVN